MRRQQTFKDPNLMEFKNDAERAKAIKHMEKYYTIRFVSKMLIVAVAGLVPALAVFMKWLEKVWS